MAEFVQQRCEDAVPIVDEIRELGLLDHTDIKEYVENFYGHQFKIQKPTRTLDDLLRFVEHQLIFLNSIEQRRQELQNFDKTAEIEEKIKLQTYSLFGSYQRYFLNDLEYWRAKLKFTNGQKWYTKTSSVYVELTNHLGRQHPYLWLEASGSEWRRNKLKNIGAARTLLQTGIRGNHGNLDLRLWRYELELEHAMYLCKLMEKGVQLAASTSYDNEFNICRNAARLTYTDTIENWCDKNNPVKVYVQFHALASNSKYHHPQFPDISDTILSDLEANCLRHEETYKVLALFAFNNGKYELAIQQLDKGVDIIPSSKMFELALDTLIMLLEASPSMPVFMKSREILTKGKHINQLSLKCYEGCLKLVDLYKDFKLVEFSIKKKKRELSTIAANDSFIAEMLDMIEYGSKKNPTSDLVSARLQLAIENDSSPAVIMKLLHSVNQLKGKIDDHLTNCLFMNAINHTGRKDFLRDLVHQWTNNNQLTIMYLRYVYLKHGMEMVWKEFDGMTWGHSYEVLKCMADLEIQSLDNSRNDERKYNDFRKIMETACLSFGKTRIDVWLDYESYEKRLGHHLKTSEIRKRGLHTLLQEYREGFILASVEATKRK